MESLVVCGRRLASVVVEVVKDNFCGRSFDGLVCECG